MALDLNLLSMFVVVAETTSFSAAAKKLGVMRSSVSRSVAALEQELRVQLFRRTTRQVAMTSAGRALYAKVASHLLSLEEAVGAVPEREDLPSGTLRVTAPVDIGALLLPGVLAAFTLRYPDVQLDMRLSNRNVDLVAEGVDVALRVLPTRRKDSSLIARRLSELEFNVFASPTYLARAGTPRSVEEAANHAWVAFAGRKSTGPLGALENAKPLWIGDDVLFVAKSVVAGIGLGLAPTFLMREDVAAGRVVRVLPRVSVSGGVVYVVYAPTRHLPRKVAAFRDFLVEHFAAYPLTAVSS